MTETCSMGVAERADVIVRELRESDLPLADVIVRCAFDELTGVASLFADRDYVRTRWPADPGAAFAAERQGDASRVMAATVARFDRWGTAHAGLSTFARSAEHLGLQISSAIEDDRPTTTDARRR